MSDYLANLVQRTLDSERAIQPRLPSLFDPVKPASNAFEPASQLSHQPSDQVAEDTVLEDSPADRLTRNHPLSGDTHQAPRERLDNPASRFTETPAHQTPARPPDNEPFVLDRAKAGYNLNRDERTAGAVNQDQPARSSTPAAQRLPYLTPRLPKDAPSKSQPDLPGSEPTIRAVESDASTGKSASAGPVTQDAATARPLASELNRQRGEKSPAARSKPEDRLSEPDEQASARSAIILRPHIFPYVEPRAAAQPPAPAESATTESIVNVTIGRIEVRATPPPARSVRTASASSPVMTLGDYLRRRANGDGR